MRKAATAVMTGSEQTVSPTGEFRILAFPTDRVQRDARGCRGCSGVREVANGEQGDVAGDSGESLFYVAPPHPRARALGWKLYIKERDLNRYILRQRCIGSRLDTTGS